MMKVQARALADIKQVTDKRWVVQDGYTTGGYRVRWAFDSMTEAALWYKGINTGNGYKKRLVDASNGQILARYIS